MYIILGYDRRYGSKRTAETFGKYDNIRDCLTYLNQLKTSTIGGSYKLWYEEK